MDLFVKKKEDELGQVTNIPNQNNPKNTPPVGTQNHSKEINELTRRMRIDEERSINIRKKIQMIEHNMLLNHKKVLTEIKFLNQEIGEIKRSFEDLKTKVMGFAHELQSNAKAEDVRVLERYINMWEPVNFVTRTEIERIIDDKLQNQRNN